MRRRTVLIIVVVVSALAALAFAAVIVTRPAAVPRVVSVGTLAPPSSSAPAPSSRTLAPTTTTVPRPAAIPATLTIDAIGVRATVVPVGVEPGTNILQIPPIEQVGWYRFGPAPGDAGSAALVGHVDGNGRPGVFWRLRDLTPGDRITVTGTDGRGRAFRVIGRAESPKAALPPELFTRTGPPRLALITCGGDFDRATRHYRDNVFVVAVPV